jgi:hypothetical protein
MAVSSKFSGSGGDNGRNNEPPEDADGEEGKGGGVWEGAKVGDIWKEVTGLGNGNGKEEEGIREGSRGNGLESERSRRSMLSAPGLGNRGRGVW